MMLTIEGTKKTFARCSPFLSILVGIWLDQIFLRPLGLNGPILTAIMVYYWALYRPDSLSAIWLFVLGIYQDLLMNVPLGISSSLYITLYLFIFCQRYALILSSFLTIWGGFVLSYTLMQTIFWFAICIINKVYVPISTNIYATLFAIIIYPFLIRVLIYIHNAEEV